MSDEIAAEFNALITGALPSEEPDMWIPYHFGHTSEGMVFVCLYNDDHARDTVWINNANGAYMLQEPLECKWGRESR